MGSDAARGGNEAFDELRQFIGTTATTCRRKIEQARDLAQFGTDSSHQTTWLAAQVHGGWIQMIWRMSLKATAPTPARFRLRPLLPSATLCTRPAASVVAASVLPLRVTWPRMP